MEIKILKDEAGMKAGDVKKVSDFTGQQMIAGGWAEEVKHKKEDKAPSTRKTKEAK